MLDPEKYLQDVLRHDSLPEAEIGTKITHLNDFSNNASSYLLINRHFNFTDSVFKKRKKLDINFYGVSSIASIRSNLLNVYTLQLCNLVCYLLRILQKTDTKGSYTVFFLNGN